MSDSRFVADGHKRAIEGLEPKLEAIRLDIKQEIEAKYASQLANAGSFKRWILYLRMKREIEQRISQVVPEIKAKAPPDALYFKNKINSPRRN